MHFSAAPNLNRGLTLIETLVVVIMVGILAAISAPSFLSWLESRRVAEAMAQLEGAIREAQREAMRSNSNCVVNISAGVNPTITATPVGCLPTGPRNLENVTVRRNSGTNGLHEVRFGFQGRTANTGIAVVALTANPTLQRCLVIAPGLGIMRTGIYAASDTTGMTSGNCTVAN